jgi:hypothetical protein
VQSLADLPKLHRRFFLREPFYGEPYALNLNKNLIEKIKAKDENECPIIFESNLLQEFVDFLSANGYTSVVDDFGFTKINEAVIPAGKNYMGFDRKFLESIQALTRIKMSHRAIDPAILYWKHDDSSLPSSEKCYERAGFSEEVKHTALEDAIGIIRLFRHGTRLPCLN